MTKEDALALHELLKSSPGRIDYRAMLAAKFAVIVPKIQAALSANPMLTEKELRTIVFDVVWSPEVREVERRFEAEAMAEKERIIAECRRLGSCSPVPEIKPPPGNQT